jgi:hypothetical protein
MRCKNTAMDARSAAKAVVVPRPSSATKQTRRIFVTLRGVSCFRAQCRCDVLVVHAPRRPSRLTVHRKQGRRTRENSVSRPLSNCFGSRRSEVRILVSRPDFFGRLAERLIAPVLKTVMSCEPGRRGSNPLPSATFLEDCRSWFNGAVC